jgi:hypothetical protein
VAAPFASRRAVLTPWRTRRGLGAAFLLCYGAACGAAQRCPSEVRVSLPNFAIAPYVLGTDKVESPPGLLIEWTRNALQLAGCKVGIVIRRRPPNRQLKELELGLLDVLPGFAFSADPDDQLVFPTRDGTADPDRAVMSDTVSLYPERWQVGTAQRQRRSAVRPGGHRGQRSPPAGSSKAATPGGFTLADRGRIDVIMGPAVVLRPTWPAPMRWPCASAASIAMPVRRFAGRIRRRRFWLELCKQSRSAQPTARSCK